MKNKFFKIIIPLLAFSMLFTACEKKPEKNNNTTTTTFSQQTDTTSTNDKTNLVIYSDETTANNDTVPTGEQTTPNASGTPADPSKKNNNSNGNKSNGTTKPSQKINTPVTLPYDASKMLSAESLLNGAVIYNNKEVYTIIKINTLTTSRTYATSEECFEINNNNTIQLGINFTNAINAKPGDVIRLKGTFINNEITNASVLEVNGAAKTEYEKNINNKYGTLKDYDTDLTWAKLNSLNSTSCNLKYRTKLTITNINNTNTATIEGHNIGYSLRTTPLKPFRLVQGKTYYAYTTILMMPQYTGKTPNGMKPVLVIEYAEQVY